MLSALENTAPAMLGVPCALEVTATGLLGAACTLEIGAPDVRGTVFSFVIAECFNEHRSTLLGTRSKSLLQACSVQPVNSK